MAYDVDDTDLNILELLQENGRRPNVEIARLLGIAESTVRKRVERMQQAGVFRTVIVPDFQTLGLHGHIIVGVHTELGKAPEIADRLAELHEVRFVALTTGAFDLVVDLFLPSVSDFLDFIQNHLALIPGIKGVETSTVLRQPKSRYNWTEMLRGDRGGAVQPPEATTDDRFPIEGETVMANGLHADVRSGAEGAGR